MVYRVFVEKREALAADAAALLSEAREIPGVSHIERVRILNRYDVENITPDLFAYAVKAVFSESQVDVVTRELAADGAAVFAVEYLPGQFDQRADSAAQCIQILSQGERPNVRSARVYLLYGALTPDEVAAVKKHVINPVDSREASLALPDTLAVRYDIPADVEILSGFRGASDDALSKLIDARGLAMDLDDIRFCREYFEKEGRDPTITEIRMIDTYWSDHCRHTTFSTTLDSIKFDDPLAEQTYKEYLATRKALGRTKPVNLMDIATLAVKHLRKTGQLARLDESEEINACTVKITVNVDGHDEPWLLLFKNETHNHPTEIEPFGGAATCIGGAIRDPLSGRSYVYGAMRLTGAGSPLQSIADTLPGKLPQKTICRTAAAGYASYGNQIGLATGIVDELYHPGYAAKRMEVGAVIAATPEKNVRRETPAPGDVVILLGGRTGRDGCGGATGSSKSHTVSSLETCGAEVQKGNAPEERKLQRLFRSYEACRMIKRCNDFGAGGVSVAIGELADGLDIDLDTVPKKYEGLDGTELAISESQERMAVVVESKDAECFLALAEGENLEATVVAHVTAAPRLVMHWRGKTIVDVSREFLASNGAEKHIDVHVEAPQTYDKAIPPDFVQGYRALAQDLNVCSRQGLSERFDSTIGAGSVLMPFGGRNQRTPVQAMVQKISLEHGHTDDCSLMAWGYNPYISECDGYRGAYLAVVESVSKLIATGAKFEHVYLTFQEYFERLRREPERWGKPTAALLGAFAAQMNLCIGAVGGKDSMSGSFESLDVPPTLISFAVTTAKTGDIVSNDAKRAGDRLVLLAPQYDRNGLPDTKSLLAVYDRVHTLLSSGRAVAAYTPAFGGVAEAVLKMCLGNNLGCRFDAALTLEALFGYNYGAFVLEVAPDVDEGVALGVLTSDAVLAQNGLSIPLSELSSLYDNVLESVYPTRAGESVPVETLSCEEAPRVSAHIKCARPRVLIPVFPGTNCEYDSARAVEDAGAEAQIMVLNNLTPEGIADSTDRFAEALKSAQMVFIPGGFSGGDEPDGSGKFITAFFRNAAVREQVTELLERRDGLMCGICNGFQALIKLGLVPYGRIIDTDAACPTLTYNTIGRHQSKIVRVRVASNRSPWLAGTHVGDIYSVPISHGEGRFIADESRIRALAANGQIATQYVDANGNATSDIRFNPNGSLWAVEGITSPDGRVFGKMGHAERIGAGLYKNVPGEYDMKMFASAVRYFK